MKHDKQTILSNMIWRFADRWLEQIVHLVVSLVLARLLVPEAYGVVSLITVFTVFLQVFVDCGFSNALIQKLDADQLDYSTVFWFNVGISTLLYVILFFGAPIIARFYKMPFIVPHIRVMSLTLVIGGFNGVPHVFVSKRMIFKKFFFSSLLGTLVSAIVGIYLAYRGFGAWALVAQRLTNQVIDGIFLWLVVRWKPTFEFSLQRLKPMFKYGSKLLLSSILWTFTDKISSLLIGKFYSTSDLAYYDKGATIPSTVVTNMDNSVQTVLFPAMAEEQNDRKHVKEMLKKSIQVACFCVFPMMLGLILIARPLVHVLYTDKWNNLVPYMRWYCFASAFYLLHTANLQVLRALGRVDIFLRLDIIKQGLGLIILAVTLPHGVLTMLKVSCIFDMVCVVINSHPNKELIDYGFIDQMKDLLPIIALNLVMGIIVFAAGKIPGVGAVGRLFIQISVGCVVYLGGAWVMKLETAAFLMETLVHMLQKKIRE